MASNPSGAALRAQAVALRASADALDLLADTLPDATGEALLGVPECRALGVGRDAMLGAANRGELAVVRGPRGKLLVKRSELERWLLSRPYVATPRANEPAPDLAAWDRAVRRTG